jgi:hypothetical protein
VALGDVRGRRSRWNFGLEDTRTTVAPAARSYTSAVLPVLLLVAALAPLTAQPADPVLVEWSFDEPGNFRGWSANSHVTEVSVRDGALRGRATGSDPIFLGPWIEIRTDALQRVEIRMKSDRGGTGQFFWAYATSGRYGGFESDRYKNFAVKGDGQFHDYTVTPLWSDPVVYRLRIDIPDDATVAIESVRVVGVAVPSGTPVQPKWEFSRDGDAEGWRALERGAAIKVAGGTLSVGPGAAVTLLAPAASITPAQVDWVSARIRSRTTMPVSVWWTARGCKGVGKKSAALIADGEFHTYNLNVGGANCWWSGADRLGLELPAASGFDIDWIRAGALPDGDPDLAVEALSAVRAINRAGVAFEVAGNAVNRGGKTATGARARIRVPDGVTVISEPGPLDPLYFGEPQRLVWRMLATAPAAARVALRIEAPGAAAAEAEAVVPVTERPDVATASYPATPQPAPTRYEIGAYYFPGWWDSTRWDPVRAFPERTPVLGFYKEGETQVTDWHIKYAVEHGVKFFAIDWYWRNGKEDLAHLYPALFSARYKSFLKYCFLYANHDPFNVHDRAEWLTVTRFWIDRHFHRDEFYKVDGKPVVIIFAPGNLRSVLGSTAAVKEALEAARQLARDNGLPGVFFMACTAASVSELRNLRDEGYDAATAYNYPTAGANGDNRAPYSAMVDGFAAYWDTIRGAGLIDYVIPASPGWDPRPWHGEDTTARPGNTPAEFRRMLENARDRLDPDGPVVRRMILIEAWNEWGEGSILEPELRYGFGQLDAVRDVFAGGGAHVDLAPPDVGLPLIEWDPPAPLTVWRSLDGWSRGQMTGLRTTGSDPTLTSPAFRTPARPFRKIVVRMGASEDSAAQLFWETADSGGPSEVRSVRFNVTAGDVREYTIAVGDNPHWRGIATRWRLDPASRAGVDIRFESIELVK